jgi:exonuclease SbcD
MSDNAARPRLKVLHTSDVHLGAYDSGSVELRQSIQDTFARVIDIGIAEGVDLMLIAGDFFDNARVRPETLAFAAEQLARLGVPIVLNPGNHDHIGPGSVYDRIDIEAETGNVRLMRGAEGETVAIRELDVEVWGRSHTEQLPDFSPFGDPPPRGKAAWQLGIGHGHYIHPRALLHHSFHIREEHLAASERDYVALGHWEQMTRVSAGESVTAAYSGAPEGLGRKDEEGHVLLVDLHEDGRVELTGHPLGETDPIAHDDLTLLEALRD